MDQNDDSSQTEPPPSEGGSDVSRINPPPKPGLRFPPAGNRLAHWLAFLLLAGFAMVNLLFVPLTEGMGPKGWLLFGLGFGIFPAEMLVMAIWLVWAPGRFAVRLAVHWAVGTELLICWFVGVLLTLSGEYALRQAPEIMRGFGLGLLPVSLAVQLPLWPLRTHLGWRIVRTDDRSAAADRPLSIGDILAGTALTALSITAIRFVLDVPGYPRPGDWIAWGIGLASAAGISLITAPVALALLLRNLDAAVGVALLAGYAIAAMIATVVTISILTGQQIPGEAIGALAMSILSFVGMVGVALMIARAQGFRLIYRSEFQRPAE